MLGQKIIKGKGIQVSVTVEADHVISKIHIFILED